MRIFPEMWASTLWPFSSSTLNMAFGSGSMTVPSRTIASSLGLGSGDLREIRIERRAGAPHRGVRGREGPTKPRGEPTLGRRALQLCVGVPDRVRYPPPSPRAREADTGGSWTLHTYSSARRGRDGGTTHEE